VAECPDLVKFIASMCRAYRLIVAPVVTPALIAALRAELDTLHELAGKMPPTIWRQPLHYMTHFPEQMLLFGPTGDHNMWAYESMFGDLKRLLKSRRHPVASILKAWGVGFALRTVAARLHHADHLLRTPNPPGFTPHNRSRTDKDITLGEEKKTAQQLSVLMRDQVKAWYRQQPTYVAMARLHLAVKEDPRTIQRYPRLLAVQPCLPARSRTS
jgi:hypothetical protein